MNSIRVARIQALAIVAILCALVLAGVGMARCTAPTPPPVKVTDSLPLTPSATSAATSTTMASQSVRITIRRPKTQQGRAPQRSTSQDAPQATFRGAPVRLDPPESADRSPIYTTDGLSKDQGSDFDSDYEEIIIELSQTVTTAASSSASVDHLPDVRKMIPDHARLGVVLITAPGVLALDYQLAAVEVPPWLAGMPLELGVDVAANTQMGALGLTIGGKGFSGVYGWSRWDLGGQGLAAGIGLRF